MPVTLTTAEPAGSLRLLAWHRRHLSDQGRARYSASARSQRQQRGGRSTVVIMAAPVREQLSARVFGGSVVGLARRLPEEPDYLALGQAD